MERLVESPIRDSIRVRKVIEVPSSLCCHPTVDDNYLRTRPGLYPDLLRDLGGRQIIYVAGHWQSLWVDVRVSEDTPAGIHPIVIKFLDSSGHGIPRETLLLFMMFCSRSRSLLGQEWFHGDCLADYYRGGSLSHWHWRILENFIAAAAMRASI